MFRLYKEGEYYKIMDDIKKQLMFVSKNSHIAASYYKYLEHRHTGEKNVKESI